MSCKDDTVRKEMHTLREQAFLVICVVMNISSMAASRSPHLSSSSCLPVSRLLQVIVSLMAVISAAVGLVGVIVVAAQ